MLEQKQLERDDLSYEVKKALDEWKAAENFLNFASDPELVEYAIYDLEAARRKYTYILGKLRGERMRERS